MTKKHYSYAERLSIELMLNDGCKIKDIETDIKRPSCNIIKEISKHSIFVFPSSFNNYNPCVINDTCKIKSFECYKTCKNIKFNICPKLSKSPHVCNGCTTKQRCRFIKKYYKAREAHDNYKLNLSSDRTGIHYDDIEKRVLNDILCPLIIRTKSVYHSIITINKSFNTSFKSKTIYWQITHDYLPVKSSDLPRYRKKNNKQKDTNYKRNIEGHSYDDYKSYKLNNANALEMQMDTVEGIKENNTPVILTLEIVEINFLFMFKIGSQTKLEVLNKLNYFKCIIKEDCFNKICEILLTDNGKEFFILDEIKDVSSRIHLFYCHPYSNFEKGSIENNHKLIRRVIPKGISLKPYTQSELNKLCSNINSLARQSLNGKSPFDLIENYIPLDIIIKLGLYKINPLEVCLIPELLGEKNIDNIKKYLDKEDIKKANIKFNKN